MGASTCHCQRADAVRFQWTLSSGGVQGRRSRCALVLTTTLPCMTTPLTGITGMIPGGYDFSSPDNVQMAGVEKLLREAHQTLASISPTGDDSLPVGVGFVLAHPSVRQFAKNVIPMLQQHKLSGPVWLFAPHPEHDPSPLPSLIESLHEAQLRTIVQVGTVAAARDALRAGADIIVAQGADAGGHQFAKVAGTIALVPEVRDAIEEGGRTENTALLAAGGIVDGRGVAAALALGEFLKVLRW
jgi:nitronate monooxygenase